MITRLTALAGWLAPCNNITSTKTYFIGERKIYGIRRCD